jgi:Ca2+-transporting ATPase
LFTYLYSVRLSYPEPLVRTLVFAVLISANIFLTLVNRSFYYSIFTTLRYNNNLVPVIIGITILIAVVLLYIPPMAGSFEFVPLSAGQIMASLGIGMASVLWFELVKAYNRYRLKKQASS